MTVREQHYRCGRCELVDAITTSLDDPGLRCADCGSLMDPIGPLDLILGSG